jgi:DNA primase
MNIADVTTLESLRRTITTATRSNAVPAKRAAPPESARSRSLDAYIDHQILGALVEFPELLDDESLTDALSQVEGDVAVTIAALHRTRLANENPVDLLERVPTGVRAAMAKRLAAPQLADIDTAREVITSNAAKLHKLRNQVDKKSAVEQLHEASQSGDIDRQFALLAERFERERHRIKR